MDKAFIQAEATRAFDCIKGGGVAILALDLSYAIGSNTQESVERVIRAKRRPAEKTNGGPGNIELSKELHILGERHHEMIRAVTVDYNLPLTVCAPVRMDHPYMRAMDPWVLERSTKDGTFSLLINGGPLLDALVPMSLDQLCPIVGSSANISLQGCNFTLESIEPEIRAVADVETNLGLSKYYNPAGTGSTILSFPNLEVIRFGVFYDKIRDIFDSEFKQELPQRGRWVHKDQMEAAAAAGLSTDGGPA